MILRRCKDCGGTVAIVRTTDTNNCTHWIIVGHGLMPCRCGKVVKMQSAVSNTLAASDAAYDALCDRWNRERGEPDGMDSH